jgi:hypothetical protein
MPLDHALIERGIGRHPHQRRGVMPAERLNHSCVLCPRIGLPTGDGAGGQQEQRCTEGWSHRARRERLPDAGRRGPAPAFSGVKGPRRSGDGSNFA